VYILLVARLGRPALHLNVGAEESIPLASYGRARFIYASHGVVKRFAKVALFFFFTA
jgi:hypothetical protein